MTTGFVLEASRGGRSILASDRTSLERSDFSYAESGSRRAVVLGSPYSAGPAWVSARDLLASGGAGGPSFPRDMHGYFALVTGDTQAGEFTVATDRFRGIDLFMYRRDGTVIISDSVELIARSVPSLHVDTQGMLEFLELGCTLADRTQFEEIKRIAPATVIEIADGGVKREERYWEYGSPALDASAPDAIEEVFAGHVREAFRLCETAAVPLTGGMDSRAILSVCPLEEGKLRCHTLGNSWNTDSRFAARICRELDLEHTLYPVDADALTRQGGDLSRWAGACSGMVNFILLAPMFEFFEAVSEECDLVLTGVGGELMRACRLFSRVEPPETVEELLPVMLGHYVMNPSEGLLRSHDGTNVREELRRTFEHLLKSEDPEDLVLSVERFYIENRVANFTSCYARAAGIGMKTWDPWVSTGILDAARRVALARKVDRLVHREVITSCSPALAGLLLSSGDIVPYGSQPAYLVARSRAFKAGQFSLKAINKMSRAAFHREIYKPSYVRDVSHLLARHHGGLFRRRLSYGDMRLTEFVVPAELEHAVESFMRDDSRFCYVLTNLLCAELWLEHLSGSTRIAAA